MTEDEPVYEAGRKEDGKKGGRRAKRDEESHGVATGKIKKSREN